MGRVARLLSIKGRLRRAPANGNKRCASGFCRSLRDGFAGGMVIMLLLGGWMLMRWQDAAINIQDSIPAERTAIEKPPPENTGDDALDSALQTGRAFSPLPSAPFEGLTEETKEGLKLPLIRIGDELSPFDAYRRPFNGDMAKPMISFVIIDYGLSDTLAQSLLDNMPAEISFALTPYAASPGKWATAARAYGHEFWLMLPMQSGDVSGVDSGPLALLRNAQNAENLRRLFSIMSTAQGYAGLVSGKDHVFGADSANDKDLTEQIFGRGLAFVESTPDVTPYGQRAALEYSAPFAQNNFWLDADLNPDAVERTLHAAALLALRNGKAIVFLPPYPGIVKKLQEWIERAPEQGIQVAPLSALTEK